MKIGRQRYSATLEITIYDTHYMLWPSYDWVVLVLKGNTIWLVFLDIDFGTSYSWAIVVERYVRTVSYNEKCQDDPHRIQCIVDLHSRCYLQLHIPNACHPEAHSLPTCGEKLTTSRCRCRHRPRRRAIVDWKSTWILVSIQYANIHTQLCLLAWQSILKST